MSTVEFGFLTLGAFAVLIAITVMPAGTKLSTAAWFVQMLALAALLSLFFWLMGWS
jgi:hypothetical protein